MPYQTQTFDQPKQGWCNNRSIFALSMILIGIFMMIGGGTISFISYTEITPPNYEAYYQRYVGSSLPRILGPLILIGGLTLFWGSGIFLVWANYQDKKNHLNKCSANLKNILH